MAAASLSFFKITEQNAVIFWLERVCVYWGILSTHEFSRGRWRRRRINSKSVKELLALFLLPSHVSLACLLFLKQKIEDESLCRACFHNCIWRSVLLIRGRKGVGIELWGEGRTVRLLAYCSSRHFLPERCQTTEILLLRK